jgi:hypothetical protein
VRENGGMTMTLHDLELGVFNDAIHRDAAALATDLREILGAPLVAYIGGVRETRAVRQWAEGTRQPQPAVVERLRLAYRVARLVQAREGRPVTQAWFQGLNPQLGDVSPARVLREGLADEVGAQVLAAARTFVGAA